MPTYDYICETCGHEFEIFQPMSDKPLEVCPKDRCARKRWAKGRVKRQLGAGAGLLFKGSGFYITDYRSDGYAQAAKKESEASAGKGKEAKSDSGAGGQAATKTGAAKTGQATKSSSSSSGSGSGSTGATAK